MVNIFSTTERLTKRENGKTADLGEEAKRDEVANY